MIFKEKEKYISVHYASLIIQTILNDDYFFQLVIKMIPLIEK